MPKRGVKTFSQRLKSLVEDRGAPVCVGLDPVMERMPPILQSGSAPNALESFCKRIIDAVVDIVPMVKIQAACFERHGPMGYAAIERIIGHAQTSGLMVILDAKRGDIGISAEHYAAGLLSGRTSADALTISGYMGPDTITPFIEAAEPPGKGIFVLVRTSNPGSSALQSAQLVDGRTVAEAMADDVAELGKPYADDTGYSLLGAVVGATHPDEVAALRARMPEQIFLVPGFGAQGGTGEDIRACFDEDGHGALITASRSVIYAEPAGSEAWTEAVTDAAKALRDDVRAVMG